MQKFSFKVNQKNFIQKINFVKSIISTKNAIPIIQNIVINLSDEGKLTLKTTDLETTMTIGVDIESFNNYGEVCVDAVKLKGLVENINADDVIEFIVNDTKATLKTPNGKYNIVAESTEEYPLSGVLEDDDSNPVIVPIKTLISIFNKTRFAVAEDELRPVMCGVMLKLDGSQVVGVATDSHVLSLCKRDSDIKDLLSSSIIIPSKPIKCMEMLFKGRENDTVKIVDTVKYFVVSNNNFSISIRKIEGKFPNYGAVIPKNNDKIIKVKIEELKQKVKLVSVCASKQNDAIVLEVIGNELKISAEDIDFNVSGFDVIGIEDKEGDDIKIKVKSSLFFDGLNNIGSEEYVYMEMSEPNMAFLLKSDVNEDDLILIMPLS